MRAAGIALLTFSIGLLAVASAGVGSAAAAPQTGPPKITTDGHLRVGRRETIKVSGFPGKGAVQVSFFPTAICEDGCGARSFKVGDTDAAGAGTFKVRVPGTFFNERERPTYFRNRERIEVEVTWEGPGHSFAHGRALPDPTIVRVHKDRGSARAFVPTALMPRAATPTAPAPRAPLPIPDGFKLEASNGYTLYVAAEPPRTGTQGELRLIANAEGREVIYEAPATITETSIQASLGAVGEVAVEFQRSNTATTVPCGKQKIKFDSGSWVGTIQFHGEEGYADAEATSVPGNLELLLGGFCGSYFSSGSAGPQEGAELNVRNPGLGPELSVYDHHPGGPATIFARTREYLSTSGSSTVHSGISIEREVAARIPGDDFTWDRRRLSTATVKPPAGIFSGSARFDLGLKAGRRWSGDLTVDMPGRADVPLTGPLLRASLRHSE